jgi:hypothetical protein
MAGTNWAEKNSTLVFDILLNKVEAAKWMSYTWASHSGLQSLLYLTLDRSLVFSKT